MFFLDEYNIKIFLSSRDNTNGRTLTAAVNRTNTGAGLFYRLCFGKEKWGARRKDKQPCLISRLFWA